MPLTLSPVRTIDDSLLTVRVYSRDIQVKFSFLGPSPFISEPEKQKRLAKRSKITKFTKRSKRRLRHIVRNSEDIWKVWIDLTYPENYPLDGKICKAHLNAFLQFLRRKGVLYLWRLEFQERGAVHFHLLASVFIDMNEIKECWYKIVGSGDEKHYKAGTSVDWLKSKRQLYYRVQKYLLKDDQSIVPENFQNVGRFWGSSRNILNYELYQKIGHYYQLCLAIKLLRKWYVAHLRGFGIKWKWKGRGFTALDGVLILDKLTYLRN